MLRYCHLFIKIYRGHTDTARDKRRVLPLPVVVGDKVDSNAEVPVAARPADTVQIGL